MNQHDDHNIEAAGQEAIRLLAELESVGPATFEKDVPPSPLRKIAATSKPASATKSSSRRRMGKGWILVVSLGSIAATLGVVSSLSTIRPIASTPTSQQPSSSKPPQPVELPSPKIQTSPYTPNTSNETINPQPAGEALTQEQALSVIKGWLDAKQKVFAPPFTSQAVDSYVANGPLWNDITKPGGSIDWLKENNSYYSYGSNSIDSQISFSGDAREPSMIVSVTQDMTLHGPNGSKDIRSKDTYRYTFRQERGSWKIWDYKKE